MPEKRDMTDTSSSPSGAPPPGPVPPDEARKDARPEPTRFVDWLDWLPWEKILIWGLFLAGVYTLRHFFFILFMTFILTYIMRSIVLRMTRFLTRGRESVWLERLFTLVCFAALLFGIYEGGKYLLPRLVAQADQLLERATRIQPREELEEIATRTVGAILFRMQYDDRSDPDYQSAFQEFRKRDTRAEAYESFAEERRKLQDRFLQEERKRIRDERGVGAQAEQFFEAWVLEEKAPEIFEKDRQRYTEQQDKIYREAYDAGFVDKPLEEAQQNPDFEKNRHDSILRGIVKNELQKDAARWKELRDEWLSSVVDSAVEAFKASPEYAAAFQRFYEREATSSATPTADRPRYPYEAYAALAVAYDQGRDAFIAELSKGTDEDAGVVQDREERAFEYETQKALAAKFLERKEVQDILASLNPYIQEGFAKVPDLVRRGALYVWGLGLQLGLCLLLSFFLAMDMHRIRAGVLQLKRSRISEFYDEIAPGLYNFGRLIGRAFQAQGVIAFFNTVLTFLAIQIIGIQNEIFLCAIVFFCSFIPVLGVVMSSVPIAIMAIIQPDGSWVKALEIIGAILVIHFIETSILNPKILGDMLHLHPVLVLTVLAIGEYFAGVWGLLLGVPVAVFILRCVILKEEIPGLIENKPLPEPPDPAQPKAPRKARRHRGAPPVEVAAQDRS